MGKQKSRVEELAKSVTGKCSERDTRESATDTFSSFSLTYEGYRESLSLWNSKGQVDLGILLGIGGRSFPDGTRGQAKRTANAPPVRTYHSSSRFFFSPPRYASPRTPAPFRFSICFCYPRNRVILPVSPPLVRLSLRPRLPPRVLLPLFLPPLRCTLTRRCEMAAWHLDRSASRDIQRDFIVQPRVSLPLIEMNFEPKAVR